jgi:hypothetical protein
MEMVQVNKKSENNEALARVRITNRNGKISKRIIDTYPKEKFSLEYAPDSIVSGNLKYSLKFPLRCLFEKEEDYFVIQSEMLGIIGTGLTIEAAENSFAEEFDFIYEKFNSLENNSLTNHNLLIKNILTQIIEKVEK